MNDRYLIGNAQAIGCREIQNNVFSTAFNEAGDLLAVLADGAVDHPNGRVAAIIAVGRCVNAFIQKSSRIESREISEFLHETALQANRSVQDAVFIGKGPRLSLTLAWFRGWELHCFNVGSNKTFLYNGHNENALGADAKNSFFNGKCDLAAKNIIGILSVGAYAHAHPMERIKIIESDRDIFNKAQAMIESVNKKRLTVQLCATALLIEVSK